MQRIRNEVGENKKKIKELEAIKVENPSRAGLSFLSLRDPGCIMDAPYAARAAQAPCRVHP